MQQFTILTSINVSDTDTADDIQAEIYDRAEQMLSEFEGFEAYNVQIVRGDRISREDIIESNEILGFGHLDPEDLGV